MVRLFASASTGGGSIVISVVLQHGQQYYRIIHHFQRVLLRCSNACIRLCNGHRQKTVFTILVVVVGGSCVIAIFVVCLFEMSKQLNLQNIAERQIRTFIDRSIDALCSNYFTVRILTSNRGEPPNKEYEN